MSDQPDTTEAIAQWFLTVDQEEFDPDDWPEGDEASYWKAIAPRVIAADRKALGEQGYAIVAINQPPPWMSEIEHAGCRSEPTYYGGVQIIRSNGMGRPTGSLPVYRLSPAPEGDQS